LKILKKNDMTFLPTQYNVAAKNTFYEYLGGGAGEGKSRLISTIF